MADTSQSILRRLRDLYSNPRGSLEQLVDQLNNFNKGRVAVINDRGAGYRNLSQEERVKQIVQGALDNVGSGGLGALGVIKTKGGNWLTGSVENALKKLKNPYVDKFDAEVARWGSPEKARQWVSDPGSSARALNNWIEGPLAKYIKRDMATEGDPVRKLAEQGVLHVNPEGLLGGINQVHPTGEFVQKLGKSDLAKRWENASDRTLWMDNAEDFTAQKYLKENPWLEKLDPKTKVYSANDALNMHSDLGFEHLTDELSNALNPESGLPRNLLLTPEQMQQMGMEKAVRHVADINAWRAAQKAKADALKANNAATVLYKDYPEGQYYRAGEGMFFNPDKAAVEEFGRNFGGQVGRYHLEPRRTGDESSVEKVAKMLGIYQEGTPVGQYLEQGDNAVFAEAPQVIEELRNLGLDSVRINDGISSKSSLVALDPSIIKKSMDNPKGLRWVELKAPSELPEGWQYREKSGNYIMPDGTVTGTGPQERALADQLKYEGDTMGHCVGGYCDDVLSGRSRIFSLRDAKGEPHVTIETRPQYFGGRPMEEVLAERGSKPEEAHFANPEIVQIKGKQNKAPNPEYLPFVQDFVKSGKWSDVGDLHNAGLIKHSGKRAEALGPYSTEEELTKYLDQFPDSTPGFAQGGSVQGNTTWRPMELDGIIGYITE